MTVVFAVLHVYSAFLICAKCEQGTLNGSLTVYHQTFFFTAAMEFPSFAPEGGKNQTVITCSCYGAIICHVLWSFQPSAGNNYDLNLQVLITEINPGVKTNWQQLPTVCICHVCSCVWLLNFLYLCLLLTFHLTDHDTAKRFDYKVNVHHRIKQLFVNQFYCLIYKVLFIVPNWKTKGNVFVLVCNVSAILKNYSLLL